MMIFDSQVSIKPHFYPFNWCVEYKDGTYLTEYDFKNNKWNDFYLIQTKPIKRFGLFNQGRKFYYENDGSFWLNGQFIQIEYHVDDEIYELTSSFDDKDCIQYKQSYMTPSGEGEQQVIVESTQFGYKTLIMKDDIQFHFQSLVCVPTFNGTPYFEVRLTSNKELNGKLVFKNKGKIVEEINTPLRKNYKWIGNWSIK